MELSAADLGSFVALLATLRSSENVARAAAEKRYADALKTDTSRVFASLSACLDASATGQDDVLRTHAATLLRRAIVQSGSGETSWSKASAAVQAHVRLALFRALERESSAQVRKLLVAVISAVAGQSSPEEAPWAELVPCSFALGKSQSTDAQEAALLLLSELVSGSYSQQVLVQRQDLGSLLNQGLATPRLCAAALSLVTEMVGAIDPSGYSDLQTLLPKVEQALKTLALSDQSAFEDCLQSLVACVEMQAVFFKPRFREWVDLMLGFAGSRGSIEDGRRSLAFEFISTVAESKHKALLKAVPDLPQRALEMAFTFLSEVVEDDGWPSVDEDEEEDDDDSLHKDGEAKVDFFVKKLGFDITCKPLVALVQKYSSSDRWEGKVAAAMAIRASGEFVTDDIALDAMAALLLQLAQDQHMRVRYAALFALGQMCHDQDSEWHSRWHSRLVPLLTQACNDPIDRCAAMAVGALEAHIAEIDDSVLSEYAQPIVETLVRKLRSTSHKGVLVAAMEALGALAAGMEGEFTVYYEQLMPMLLEVVSKPDTDPSVAQLRGKAFECISLLGYSVGKEHFAPAAQLTMKAILAVPSATDVQSDCIRDAMERMCKVLGSDFGPFLPALLPGILASLSIESMVSMGSVDGDDEDDEDTITVPTDDGVMKVKTGQIEETLAIVTLLCVFVKETGPSFLEYVKPTAQALARILACADSVLHLASDVRDAVYPCWAELVAAVSRVVPSHGNEAQSLVVELVQQFVDKVGADIAKAEDPDDIAPMAQGVASVVANAGAGCLQPAQVKGICDLAISEILKSFQREKTIKDSIDPAQQGVFDFNPPRRHDADEDDEEAGGEDGIDGEEDDESACRIGLAAICGACMKVSPEVFVSHSWPPLQGLIREWLGSQGCEGRLLGLHFARDLCQNLGEQASAVWPVFMDAVLQALSSDDTDERQVAAYAVNLAARTAAFGAQYASRAYVALGKSLQQFKAKKNDDTAQRASDSTTAALVQLCLSHPAASPDLEACWKAAFERLPLKLDVEEGQRLHRRLFTEAQLPGGGALGGMARVAQALGYLCEIYGRSEHCDDELQADIAAAFARLPQETLQGLRAQLSAKQQKKLERILQDGQNLA